MKVFDFEDQTPACPRTLIKLSYLKKIFNGIKCYNITNECKITSYYLAINIITEKNFFEYETQLQRDKVYNKLLKVLKLKAGK
ncbi:MAG: hypothetical protein PHS93_08125 [Candidatus Omnitrophica bacterium]|nr:hypothetical protein [Candidatus Omnitrophota bacterium]